VGLLIVKDGSSYESNGSGNGNDIENVQLFFIFFISPQQPLQQNKYCPFFETLLLYCGIHVKTWT
jgi:hypothetical protein